jgi:voltage-gated potassium channel
MALRSTIPTAFGSPPGWRGRLHEIIFGWDSGAGRAFDIGLIVAISVSVLAVMLESVHAISSAYGPALRQIEWFFTVLFTIEYALRLISVANRWRYATSFFGVVDLLAIFPTFLSVLMPGAQYMLVIRLLRVLRVFRIMKLVQYVSGANVIMAALRASVHKIAVFVVAVVALVTIVGSLMYVVEGADNGFTSIPRSIYWATVTITTVGYGDISPRTNTGQFLASLVMLMGYSIIAVPTGIVTVELTRARSEEAERMCAGCDRGGHDADAAHCKYCGAPLET